MRSLVKDDKAILLQLLVGAAMAVIIFFAIMNIGTFINNTIDQELVDSLDIKISGNDGGTVWYNNSEFAQSANRTLLNISGDYDNVVDSLAVAAVVMAITLPLAAVVAIRKFF